MKTFFLSLLFLLTSSLSLGQKDLDLVAKYYDSIYLSEVYNRNWKPKNDKGLLPVANLQLEYLKTKKNMFLSHKHGDNKYYNLHDRFELTVNKNKKYSKCYKEYSEVLCRVGQFNNLNEKEIAKLIFDGFMKSPSHKESITASKFNYVFVFDYSVDKEIICVGVVAN
jgi:hypothetical protein